MLDHLFEAMNQVLLDPWVLAVVVLSACYGVFLGAMPGLTATMGVALFVPMTYWMEPVPALAAIVTMVACAIFAGDIPTTLVRVPGTPASAAYADDAYALAQRGDAGKALGASLWFSVSGGIFGASVLMVLGHQLARLAAWFSVAEYFWLYMMGLSCAVVVGRFGISRSLAGLMLGLLFSSVGLSAVHGQARFTFGHPELFQGINFIPAMIGLFGLSEVFRSAMHVNAISTIPSSETVPSETGPDTGILRSALQTFLHRPLAWLRSSGVGAAIGVLPGAGADMAAWVCVAISKRFSKRPELYGRGSTDCIADACAANSASLAGAWIPAMVFGIPGDSVTAIVIGVLYMKNLKPGPEIFEQQGTLVYSIFVIFLLANLVLLPIGWFAIKLGRQVLRVPRPMLLPVILLFCVVGSYAVKGSTFDIVLMLLFGLLGMLCERWKISIGALVLGLILGGPLEERFVQTLSSGRGSYAAFFDRPVAAVLGFTCITLWCYVILSLVRRRIQSPSVGTE